MQYKSQLELQLGFMCVELVWRTGRTDSLFALGFKAFPRRESILGRGEGARRGQQAL